MATTSATNAEGLRRGRPANLQSPWIVLALCLAAIVPVAVPSLMPLTDVGGHLGRFTVQLDAGRSADLRQWYGFAWDLIPNLGIDLLIEVLGPWLGLEPALKAIVIGIAALQAGGFLTLARAAHGRVPPTALFALPLIYSYPFHFGFLNFVLSVALASWALAGWIVLGEAGRVRQRWLVFVPVACLLWLCHLAGWALFCIFAGADELVRRKPVGRFWTPRDLALCAVALSCLLTPWAIKLALPSESAGQGATIGFFNPMMKVSYLLQVLRDRWQGWDTTSAALLVAGAIWFHCSRWFARHNGLALGALLAFVVYLVTPSMLLGSYFADMRIAPVFLGMALLSVRPSPDCPPRLIAVLTLAGLAFVGLRYAGNTASFVELDRQFSRDLSVLDAVPRGSQLVTLVLRPCETLGRWQTERRTHLAGYALARRHAFANDQWTIPGGQLLQVHNPALGAFQKDPSQHVSDRQCGVLPSLEASIARLPAAVPLIWVIGRSPGETFTGWREIRRNGGSAIYARTPAP